MAPSRKSTIDGPIDPREALAKWQGERYSALSSYQQTLNLRENELLDANGRVGPRSKAYRTAAEDLHKAELMHRGIEGVLQRPLNRYHIPFAVFVTLTIALALLEAPVNKFLFDVALQSIGIFSFLASFVLAACLLILAHLAGTSIRQVWSEYRLRVVWSSLIAFLLIVAVLFTVVGVLTVGRALMAASTMGSFQDMFSAVRTTVVERGFWSAIAASFGDIHALILATVNIGGIFAAMMLAYYTHDPDKDYDAASRAVERLRKKMDRLDLQYSKAKQAVIAKHAPSLTAYSTIFKDANRNVIELKRRLGLPLDEDEDSMLIDKLDTLAKDSELGRPDAPEPRQRDEAEDDAPPAAPRDTRRPMVVANRG